jgi:hypothetical protein
MGPKSKNKGAKAANQVALDKRQEKSDENRWKQINAFSRNEDTPQGYNSDDDNSNDVSDGYLLVRLTCEVDVGEARLARESVLLQPRQQRQIHPCRREGGRGRK